MKTSKSALESFELKFSKKLKNCIFDHFWALHPIFHTHMPFSHIGNFGQPHALLIFKNGQIERIEIFFSEIKNMDHKLSNDVSNVFIRHLVQILSHFEIFSKHVILTRKRGGGLKKNVTILRNFWNLPKGFTQKLPNLVRPPLQNLKILTKGGGPD